MSLQLFVTQVFGSAKKIKVTPLTAGHLQNNLTWSGHDEEEATGYAKGIYCHISRLSSSGVLLPSEVDFESIDSSSEVLKDIKKTTGHYFKM